MIPTIYALLGALSALCIVGFARESLRSVSQRQHTRAHSYAARLRAANAARDIAQARALAASADAARAADALMLTQRAQQQQGRALSELRQQREEMARELVALRAERRERAESARPRVFVLVSKGGVA